MKKDKEWLKRRLVSLGNKPAMGNDYFNEGWFEAYESFSDLIDQLDEPEVPVIPQFVADWIEINKNIEIDYAFELIKSRAKSGKLDEFDNWVNKNKKMFAVAFVAGYTIEKEKMYQVVFPFTGSSEKTLIQRIFTGNTWADDVEDDFEIIAEDHKVEFTEQEIKAIDERYWAFAEEVME